MKKKEVSEKILGRISAVVKENVDSETFGKLAAKATAVAIKEIIKQDQK